MIHFRVISDLSFHLRLTPSIYFPLQEELNQLCPFEKQDKCSQMLKTIHDLVVTYSKGNFTVLIPEKILPVKLERPSFLVLFREFSFQYFCVHSTSVSALRRWKSWCIDHRQKARAERREREITSRTNIWKMFIRLTENGNKISSIFSLSFSLSRWYLLSPFSIWNLEFA